MVKDINAVITAFLNGYELSTSNKSFYTKRFMDLICLYSYNVNIAWRTIGDDTIHYYQLIEKTPQGNPVEYPLLPVFLSKTTSNHLSYLFIRLGLNNQGFNLQAHQYNYQIGIDYN
jgi:hypothetical protein